MTTLLRPCVAVSDLAGALLGRITATEARRTRRGRNSWVPLVLLLQVVLGSFHHADAEITVTGEKAGFKDLVNSLLEAGVTVDIDAAGKLTIAGNPTKELGKNIKKIIDSATKITVNAVSDGDGVITGSFDGNGVQTIDIKDIPKYAAPGSMLPTKGAQLKHELEEVFDSVKDGKTNPPSKDGGADYRANHAGSAKTAEDAVNKEESGITRKGEGTPSPMVKQSDGSSTFKIKEKYDKDGKEILVDTTFRQNGAKIQVEGVAMEVVPPKAGGTKGGGGRYVSQEEPGIQVFGTDFHAANSIPLNRPGYLEVDPFGKLYVSEQALNAVLVFDSDLNLKSQISHPMLNNPQGIAVAPLDGTIFVASGDRILEFNPGGSLISTLSDPLLKTAKGLEVDRDGNLYASSFDQNLVLKFDSTTGSLLSTIGDPLLMGPEGIAIDQLGRIWVASFLNDMILEFNPDGSFARVFASGGLLDGPKGLGLTPQSFVIPGLRPGGYGDFAMTLLVSSFNNNMVLEYDLETGALINSVAIKSPVGVGQLLTLVEVPEPSSLVLLGTGALGLLCVRRHRRRAAIA